MKKLTAASILLFSLSALAASPDFAGPWTLHSSVSGTDWDQQCNFERADKKLTGTCKTADQPAVPITGTVDAMTATWTQPGEYQGTPLTLTYTAKLDEAGKMTGSVDVQPFAVTGEFTATVPPPPPSK